MYLLEEEMQLHLENLHSKPSSKLSPESLLSAHECQLLGHNRKQQILQNNILYMQHTGQIETDALFSFTMFKEQSNHIQMSFPGGFHERRVPKNKYSEIKLLSWQELQASKQCYINLKYHFQYNTYCLSSTYPSSLTSSRNAPLLMSKSASSTWPPQAANVKGDSKLSAGILTCKITKE